MTASSVNTFSQSANDVRSRQLPGLPGMPAGISALFQYIDLTNSWPQAKQVSTGTITGGTGAGNSVIMTVAGIVKTYTTTSADTSTTIIATNFAAFLNSDPILGGIMVATSALAVVTLTAITAGDTFTVASGTNCTAATSTTAATADPVPFGVAVCSTTETSSIQPATFATRANKTLFTAQVVTLTAVYAANQEYSVDITINGTTYQTTTLANTDTATTCTAIATAINAIMPASTVIADGSSGTTVVLTAEVAGFEFSVATRVLQNPTSNLTQAATTGPSIATSFDRAFMGASRRMDTTELLTIGGTTSEYPANAGFQSMQKGQIWVASSQTVTQGQSVWVELDDASDLNGDFFNTQATATCALLSRSKGLFVRTPGYAGTSGGAPGVVVLSVNVAP